MRYSKSLILLWGLVWLVVSASAALGSATLSIVPGNWSLSVTGSDLLAGPGSDLKPTYEDVDSPTFLNITGTSGIEDSWRIDVKRVDLLWNPNLSLSAKVASDGTGPGSLMGGESYQQIESTDTAFFSGTADRTNIRLQMELGGMSLKVPPSTYSTTIVYTVVDL